MQKILLGTISNVHQDWLPYASGCLISYANKDPFIKENYTFLEPEWRSNCLDNKDFHTKIEQTDILGLTCYVWNQVINDQIAKLFKSVNPKGIVIFGGPNVPEDEEEIQDYINTRQWVDYFFIGPGEEIFLNFLKSNKNEKFVYGKQIKPEDLSSPYAENIFKSILRKSGNISAAIETNRGCPYSCSFCDWGGQASNKIIRFDKDLIKNNITTAMEEKNIIRLEILDANFGVFEQDLKYVQHIISEKDRLNKHSMLLTFAGLAKNGSKHLIEIMKLVLDNFNDKYRNVKISFQTLTDDVLVNIDRKNIKSEKLYSITSQLTDVTINSEIIIGLPGETSTSFLDTLCKHIELNIDFARTYPLYVLPNTPMNKKEYRKKFNINSKKIYLPYDLSKYRQSKLYNDRHNLVNIKTACDFKTKIDFESFEMIYSCVSYNPAELIQMYDYWFWYNTFYNAGVAKKYIKEHTLAPQEQAFWFFNNLDNMPFFNNLVNENRSCAKATVACTEPETFVYTLRDLNWLHKAQGRGIELVEIYNNQNIVTEELKQLYSNYNTSHFNNINERDLPKLMSSFSSIDGVL
jgi:tRNA A37 methylthiotransferase MiaB